MATGFKSAQNSTEDIPEPIRGNSTPPVAKIHLKVKDRATDKLVDSSVRADFNPGEATATSKAEKLGQDKAKSPSLSKPSTSPRTTAATPNYARSQGGFKSAGGGRQAAGRPADGAPLNSAEQDSLDGMEAGLGGGPQKAPEASGKAGSPSGKSSAQPGAGQTQGGGEESQDAEQENAPQTLTDATKNPQPVVAPGSTGGEGGDGEEESNAAEPDNSEADSSSPARAAAGAAAVGAGAAAAAETGGDTATKPAAGKEAGSSAPKDSETIKNPANYRDGFAPKSSPGSGSRNIANYIKRHPRGTIYGIFAIIGALISLVVFIISIPFQLIDAAKSLLEFNQGPGDRIEKRAIKRTWVKFFQEKTAINGGAIPPENLKSKFIRKTLGYDTPVEKLTKMLDQYNIALEFDKKTGRLTTIRDTATGEALRDFSDASFLERRSVLIDLIHDQIPVYRVLKRMRMVKVAKFHARVSFRFWPKEKVQDIKKLLYEKVRFGASPDELLKPGQKPDPKAPPTDPNSAQTADEAIKATEDAFASTGSKTGAIKAGAEVIASKGGKFFGITAILAMVCAAQQVANDAASQGYIDRTFQLMRMGFVLPVAAAQLINGKDLDIDKFGALMGVLVGNPNAPKEGANKLDRKGWDQSAAHKRHLGLPVVTDEKSDYYNPDLSEASNPDGFMLQKIMDRVNQIIDAVSGAGFICSAVSGIFGWVIQGIELASAIISGGLEAAAAAALQVVISLIFFVVIVPKLLAAAANLAVTGLENSVDFFNNSDAGARINAEDYLRNIGGRQLSEGEQTKLTQAYHEDQVQIARRKGWFYRNLDINNLNSVAANVLRSVPSTPQTVVAAITNMPRHLVLNLGTIFMGSIKPASADFDNINPYGFQFYGFTDAELDKYDNIDFLENYFTDPIPGTDKTRLSVLGDASQYSPADGDDTNMGDLLHCFVNTPRSPEELRLDPICNGIGAVTGVHGTGSRTDNPGDAVISQIYQDNGLNVTIDDDFTRYRMYLLYVHAARGLHCTVTTDDCFQGTPVAGANPAPTTSSAACQTGESDIDCAARLATAILANKNIIAPPDPHSDLVATVNKQSITNTCGTQARLAPQLLYALLQSATDGGFKITLSVMITGHHCNTADHPKGRALDVDNLVDSQGHNSNAGCTDSGCSGENPAVDKAFSEYIAKLLPDGGGIGQAVKCYPANLPAGIRSAFDVCTHIHVELGDKGL